MTGGGDCSGLNAVIRSVTQAAVIQHGCRVIGIERGFDGLVFDWNQELTLDTTRDILTLGGTILGTTNKGNPFAYREYDEQGGIREQDLSQKVLVNFRRLELDCLFVVGGDGTLQIAYKLFAMGLPVIAIPKTIDNDLEGTDYTFGFQTAVQVACDALDRLKTTGKSHQRVMILEVMGRSAGWIALESGIAGGAHIILIPEIPYKPDKVLEKIKQRESDGNPYSIIVVAEGAKEMGGHEIILKSASDRLQGAVHYGGVGNYLAEKISQVIDLEVRCTVLGHTQRGGTPNCFDRVLGTRLGAYAVQAAAKGQFGNLVALKTPDISLVPFQSLAGTVRRIPPHSQLIQCAESIGISLGR
ncbi:MAG: ATP-dependent 6-phosphofructokinase [Nitrospinaceae bacterium]|nr:MAG: ATP-dependent 6-phosphofructokinase [Nitrospinaceae bacterium]